MHARAVDQISTHLSAPHRATSTRTAQAGSSGPCMRWRAWLGARRSHPRAWAAASATWWVWPGGTLLWWARAPAHSGRRPPAPLSQQPPCWSTPLRMARKAILWGAPCQSDGALVPFSTEHRHLLWAPRLFFLCHSYLCYSSLYHSYLLTYLFPLLLFSLLFLLASCLPASLQACLPACLHACIYTYIYISIYSFSLYLIFSWYYSHFISLPFYFHLINVLPNYFLSILFSFHFISFPSFFLIIPVHPSSLFF